MIFVIWIFISEIKEVKDISTSNKLYITFKRFGEILTKLLGFKSDLFEFFKDDKYKKMKVLELGACHGDTTRIFAEIFEKVFAVDRSQDNVERVKKKCEDVNNVGLLTYDALDRLAYVKRIGNSDSACSRYEK